MKKLLPYLLAALAVFFAVTAVSPVFAHAALVRTDPPDNAILEESPEEMRLWFNEAINADFSTFKVLDLNGEFVKLTSIRRDEADPKLIILGLPELAEGVYSVHWHVLSAIDGHETQGFVVFGLGAEADVSAVADNATATTVPWLEVILRWLNYSALALLTGAIIVRYLLLRDKHAQDTAVSTIFGNARQQLANWAWRIALAALVIGVGLLLQQLLQLLDNLPDNATLLGVTGQLLTKSRWGLLWLARQGLIIGILFLWSQMRKPAGATKEGARLLAIPLAFTTLALLTLQALNGHAAAVAEETILIILADIIHLLAMGAWLGSLGLLILILFPVLRKADKKMVGAILKAGWRPFGRIAALSVVLLSLTGLYSAGFQVATVDALVTTLYGQTLLGKVSAMLVMGLFGLANAMLLHPRLAAPLARLLRRPTGWTPFSLQRLPQLMLVEITLGALILISVGVITALPNPLGPEFAPFPKEQLLESQTQSYEDMIIGFSAKPNIPGQNVFLVRATSIRRPAPAEIMRVILHFTYLEDDIGTITVDAQDIGDAQYHLGGSYFSLPGKWQVDVAVRRSGVEDTLVSYEWIVPPSTEPKPIVLSDQPLRPLLSPLALAGFVTLILALLLGTWRQRKRPSPLKPIPPETSISA